MTSKQTIRTYTISKQSVWNALNNTLAPLPSELSVKSYNIATGVVLTGVIITDPTKFFDTVDISISNTEIANFVNNHCGTSFLASNIAGVADGSDSSFYEVTVS